MPRIFTEIRISHKTTEDKERFEKLIDEALKAVGQKNRNEWIYEKFCQLVGEMELQKLGIVKKSE